MTMSLVIGSAGVGKSTLLRELVLRGGSAVDVALHARHSTANEVAARIAHAMSLGFVREDEEVRAERARDLLARRLGELPGRTRPRPLIVVDSLDEAREHSRTTARFLRVASIGADLLVALRTGHDDLVGLLHPGLTIDLDSDEYFEPIDMVRFVERVLVGEAPALDPVDRERAVQQVSRAAGRNFLIGGLLALARATALPTEWDRQPLPENVADAMRLFVDRLAEPERAWELLLMPALAEGGGWPIDLWAPGVSRLSGRRSSGAEIEDFRTSAAEYLIEHEQLGHELGVRPYHDALGATVLIERVNRRRRPGVDADLVHVRDQSGIVDVLLDHVRQFGWHRCLGYVRTHLASHAAKAGRLPELLGDPRFVCAAEPGRLQLAIAATPGAARIPISECHRLTVHLLGDNPRANAYLLRLAALYQGHRELAERIGRSHQTSPIDVLDAAVDTLESQGNTHTDWVTAVEPYVILHGWRVASSSADRTIRIWDPDHPGGPPLAVLTGHTDCVRDVKAFRADGIDYLASASDDGTVRLWDVSRDQGRLVQTFRGHTDWVRAVCAFQARTGWRLASGSDDATVRIWEIGQEEPIRTLTGHTSWVTSLVAVKGGFGWRLISGSDDRTARVWDPEADVELVTVCSGHTDCIHGVGAFESATGWCLATASDDRSVRIWHMDTGELRQVLRGHPRPVRAVVAVTTPGGPKLATGSTDQRVRIWDAEATDGQPEQVFVGHNDWVRSVRVLQHTERPRLVSGSDDGTLRTWDLSGSNPDLTRVFGGQTRWLRAVCTFPISSRLCLAAAGTDGRIAVWDVVDEGLVARPTLVGHSDWIRALTVLEVAGTTCIVSAGDDGKIHVWDLGRPEEPLYTLTGHHGPVRGVCSFQTRGQRRLASVGDDLTLRTWVIDNDRCAPIATVEAHSDWIRCVTSVPSGSGCHLITGSDDQTLGVWQVHADGRLTRRAHLVGHTDSVRAVCAFSRKDRSMIASTSDDGTLRLWDPLEDSGIPLRTIEAHKASGLAVCYLASADGGRVVTASADQTLKFWDTTGRYLATTPTLAPNFAVTQAGEGRLAVGNQRGLLLMRVAERLGEN